MSRRGCIRDVTLALFGARRAREQLSCLCRARRGRGAQGLLRQEKLIVDPWRRTVSQDASAKATGQGAAQTRPPCYATDPAANRAGERRALASPPIRSSYRRAGAGGYSLKAIAEAFGAGDVSTVSVSATRLRTRAAKEPKLGKLFTN